MPSSSSNLRRAATRTPENHGRASCGEPPVLAIAWIHPLPEDRQPSLIRPDWQQWADCGGSRQKQTARFPSHSTQFHPTRSEGQSPHLDFLPPPARQVCRAGGCSTCWSTPGGTSPCNRPVAATHSNSQQHVRVSNMENRSGKSGQVNGKRHNRRLSAVGRTAGKGLLKTLDRPIPGA